MPNSEQCIDNPLKCSSSLLSGISIDSSIVKDTVYDRKVATAVWELAAHPHCDNKHCSR